MIFASIFLDLPGVRGYKAAQALTCYLHHPVARVKATTVLTRVLSSSVKTRSRQLGNVPTEGIGVCGLSPLLFNRRALLLWF
jgi:hypothetical protein